MNLIQKNDQVFDIIIPKLNNDLGGDDTYTDEELIHNNESNAKNCNESHVSEDHSNDDDFDNDNNSDGDGYFECNNFFDTSNIDNFLTTTDDPVLINYQDNDNVVNDFTTNKRK